MTMGTRADFYVGRGVAAEWLGSIAMDGYPDGISEGSDVGQAATSPVLTATDEATYRARVAEFLAGNQYATLPEHGWPWPWENSRTTDYAYAFDGGVVYGSCFGSPWFIAAAPEPDHDESDGPRAKFPEMSTGRAAPAGHQRSGIMVFGAP